jgi:hypothetical protein
MRSVFSYPCSTHSKRPSLEHSSTAEKFAWFATLRDGHTYWSIPVLMASELVIPSLTQHHSCPSITSNQSLLRAAASTVSLAHHPWFNPTPSGPLLGILIYHIFQRQALFTETITSVSWLSSHQHILIKWRSESGMVMIDGIPSRKRKSELSHCTRITCANIFFNCLSVPKPSQLNLMQSPP